ncbi:MAG: hypothetical protein ABSH29_21385 [Acidimicrobiales bacterium]
MTAKLVGQLTTGMLVATASSSAVEFVGEGWVVEVAADRGRTVGPVVVGGAAGR